MEKPVGVQDLISEAEKEIEAISAETGRAFFNDPEVVFVDVRDVRELQREGKIPRAFHAPRGMLEFWIDPKSPYHKEVFKPETRFVFFCALGWRSILATQTANRMGLENAVHMDGGFTAWREAGYPIEIVDRG